MSQNPLVWELKKQSDGMLVIISGDLNENSRLHEFPQLSGNVTFDLAGIRRINSEGVRLWIGFVRKLDAISPLIFVRCSVAFVTQLNMIHGFQGKAEIHSFYAPYLCPETGEEQEQLLTREAIKDPGNPPTFPCDGGTLELDDIPEKYFAFLMQK